MAISADKFIKKLPKKLRKKLPKTINVGFVTERMSRKLNHRYRGQNKPANTLSFRYGSDCGEVLLCPEVIRREAKRQGHSYKYQLNWMIVHGILHLAGVHHEKSRRASRKFGEMESSLLAKIV